MQRLLRVLRVPRRSFGDDSIADRTSTGDHGGRTIKGSELLNAALKAGQAYDLHQHYHVASEHGSSFSSFSSRDRHRLDGIVAVGVRVREITDIDTASCSFRACLRIFYEWRLPEDGRQLIDGQEVHVDDDQIPELTLMNALEVTSQPWQRPPRVMNAAQRVVQTHRQYSGIFYENMELHDFPFDVQRLHINLQLANRRFKTCGLRLLPLELRGLTQQPQWSFISPRVNDRHAMAPHGWVSVQLVVRRESFSYMRSHFVVTSLLTTLGVIVPFAIPHEDIERVEVSIAVLFTVIAFQLTDSSPQVGYNTALDKHQMTCTLFSILLTLLHTIMLFQKNGSEAEASDDGTNATAAVAAEQSSGEGPLALGMMLGLWVAIQGYFYGSWLLFSLHAKKASAILKPDDHDLISWTEQWSQMARALSEKREMTAFRADRDLTTDIFDRGYDYAHFAHLEQRQDDGADGLTGGGTGRQGSRARARRLSLSKHATEMRQSQLIVRMDNSKRWTMEEESTTREKMVPSPVPDTVPEPHRC